MTQIKIQNIKRSTKLNYDMKFLGNHLLRDEKAVARVIYKFAGRDSFIGFLAQYGISTGEQGAAGVANETIAESLVRWRIVDNTYEACRIVDVSTVPQTITANTPFEISLNEGWVDTDGLLLSSDGKTIFYVRGKKPNLGIISQGVTYILEWPSPDPTSTITSEMLQVGKYMNYISNAKGERSSTSQEIKIDHASYDLFNVTQVVRHKISASGHALSTDITNEILLYEEVDSSTKKAINQYVLPFSGKLLQKHLESVSSLIYFGRTNFDAYNRVVRTLRQNGGGNEIPLMAGVKQQFEYTERVGEYNPFDSPARNLEIVESIISQSKDYYRKEMVDFIVITGGGGRAVLKKIQKEKTKQQGVSLRVSDSAVGNGQGTIAAGLRWDETYQSDDGTLKIMNTQFSTKPRGFQIDKKVLDGVAYDIDGYDMYFVPIGMSETVNGARTVRIATKKKGSLNRGLVLGSIAGMSGLHGNGMDMPNLTDSDMKFINSVANQQNYKVASPVDGEEFMVLSELTVIVENPDDIYWLKAKFDA